MNDFDNDREREFFEWFAVIQEQAEKHDVSIYTVVNARQIWDTAYAKGVAQNKRTKEETNE
jgi:hypothetical protein